MKYIFIFACKITKKVCNFVPEKRKLFMRLTKKRYLLGFLAVVVVLACVRRIWPEVAFAHVQKPVAIITKGQSKSVNRKSHHKIRSVSNYQEAFPDTNGLQLTAAAQWGVTPVANRADAETRKRELVYMAANPYYHVDPL